MYFVVAPWEDSAHPCGVGQKTGVRGRLNPPVAVWKPDLLWLYSFFMFLYNNPAKCDSGAVKHREWDPKQCTGLALSREGRGGGAEMPRLEGAVLVCRKASLSTSLCSGFSSGQSLVLKTSLSNEVAGLPVCFHSTSKGGDGDPNIWFRPYPRR